MIHGYWQTDPRLLPKIQKYGCALLDCCYLSPDEFQPSDVNEMYKSLLSVKFVDEDCTILSWQNVLWSISPFFSFKEKVGKGYVCTLSERDIIKFHLSNIDSDHFCVGDGSGNVIWDSMNRPLILKKYATFKERVIVRVF